MALSVWLVNPSRVSFGVAVITPRWLYVLAAATGTEWGDPKLVDETLGHFDLDRIAARRRRRHRHPHGQRAPRLRDRPRGARARRLGRLRRHPRHALSGRGPRARRGARGGQGRRRSHLADGHWRLRRGAAVSGSTKAGESRATRSCQPAGICCRATATCGHRCRRCAAARNTARSARSGAPTASARACARVDAVVNEIVELRRLGFRFIALADDNFYPVPLERPRGGPPARRSRRGCTSSRRCARSGSS